MRDDHIDDDIKTCGLKVTGPRVLILEFFQTGAHEHITADEVHRRLLLAGHDVGLATVYRVLSQFEAAGLLRRSQFDTGKAVFELNEGHHHDHMVCVRCGRVEEFVDEKIEQRQRAIALARGFELREHTLALYGICSRQECKSPR